MSAKKRILIVDDDDTLLKLLDVSLSTRKSDWHLECAESGPAAIEKLQDAHFDAVVSDVQMPGMTGIELLNKVKIDYPDTVRILHSASTDGELFIKSIECSHQYLRKPWSLSELTPLLESAFVFQDLLRNERLQELVSKPGALPNLPATLVQLMEEIDSVEPDLDKIASILSRDIAMTAKILRFTNSAYVGLRAKVSDLGQAVRFLGLEHIRALALAHGVFSQFSPSSVTGLNIYELHAHSISVAGFARAIAKAEFQDSALAGHSMVAGILHDIGMLLLAMRLPDDYAEVIRQARENVESIWSVEQRLIGATHAEVGAYLLGIWGLPKPIVEAVAFHHQPDHISEVESSPLLAVSAANLIWHEIHDKENHRVSRSRLERIGFGDRLDGWRALCVEIEKRENAESDSC